MFVAWIQVVWVLKLCLGRQEYDFLLHRITKAHWSSEKDGPEMDVFDRMLLLARQIYEDANLRVLEMDDYRWMYEETPEYESGYIMGEIMDRYRKLLEEGRMSYANLDRKYDALKHGAPGLLQRLEKGQFYYLELYHLVRMLHEVIPKYKKGTKKLGSKRPAIQIDPNILAGLDPGITMEDVAEETEKQKVAREKKEAAERREKARKERMEQQRESIADRIAEREKLKDQKKYGYYDQSKLQEYTRWPSQGSGALQTFPFDYGWDIAGWW